MLSEAKNPRISLLLLQLFVLRTLTNEKRPPEGGHLFF
jgi:hypothetical protein